MDFINTYNDAEILIDAANNLDAYLRHSPAFPGILKPFAISIDGEEVNSRFPAREAFFAFLRAILNRWYNDFPANQVPSLKIRVAILCNEIRRILLAAPPAGVVVYWRVGGWNGEFVVNPDDDRKSDLQRVNAPCLILDANALEVETFKEE